MPITLYHGPAGSGKTGRILGEVFRRHLRDNRLDGFHLVVDGPASVQRAQEGLLELSGGAGLFLGESLLGFDDFLLKLLKISLPRVHPAPASLSRNLIRRLLTEKAYPSFQSLQDYPKTVDALSTTFVRLKKSGLNPRQARGLMERFLNPVLEDLLTLFSAYQDELRRLDYFDEGDRTLEALTLLRERRLKLPPGLRHLYFDRIFPLTLGQREILKAFSAEFPELDITVSYSFDYRAEEDPYLYPAYGFLGELAARQEYFPAVADCRPANLSILPDPASEMDWLAGHIEADHARGVALSSIGVVLPGHPFYHRRLSEALRAKGINCGPSSPLSLSAVARSEDTGKINELVSRFLHDRMPPLQEALAALSELKEFEERWGFESDLLLHGIRDTQKLQRWRQDELKRVRFQPGARKEGVRLFRLEEAASADCEILYVPGYCQAHYPSPAQEHPFYTPDMLLDPGLREILEGPVYRLSVERHRLSQAIARTKDAVRFSHPKILWDGQEQFASRLLNLNLTAETPPPERDTVSPSPKPAAFPRPHKTHFSISEIETYLKCPYQYYARHHLALGEAERDDTDVPGDVRGSFVHRVLDRLLKENLSLYAEAIEYDLYVRRLAEKVDEIIHAEKNRDAFLIRAPEAIRESFCKRVSQVLAAYLKLEIQQIREGKKKTRPQYLEWAFGRGKTPALTLKMPNGQPVHLSGRIDRIDVNEGLKTFSVVDYKTGELDSIADLKKGASLQIPLYLSAVSSLLLKGYAPSAGVLVSLKELNKFSGLAIESENGDSVLGKRHLLSAEEWDALQEDIRRVVIEAVQKIREGKFAPDPRDAALCRNCDYRTVCHQAEAEIP